MQTEVQEHSTDLLANFGTNIVRASSGKRLSNYLIDLIVFYILAAIVGVVIGLVKPGLLDSWDNTPGSRLFDWVISTLEYSIYMFTVEAVFKGKSLGKLITGTRAVNLDGSPITTKTALGRGFARAVPFNALSALGSPSDPWHDRWNETLVMDEKLSTFAGE